MMTIDEDMRGTAGGGAQPSPVITPGMAAEFLSRRYGENVIILHKDESSLEAKVRRLKNVVLVDHHYWEDIHIYLTFNDSSLRGAIDVRYASGLGKTAPPAEAFNDVCPRYAEQLEEFTKRLITALLDSHK